MTARTPRPTAVLPFADALSAALDVAVLSPSSHNCQPWGLAGMVSAPARRRAAAVLGGPRAGREYLVLALDRERRLGALPAHAAEMLLSCGLYWRLLQRALAAQGWVAERSETVAGPGAPPALGLPPSWEPLCAAEFRRAGEPDGDLGDLGELRALARRRHTNRAPYRSGAVEPELLTALERPGGTVPGGTGPASTGPAGTGPASMGDGPAVAVRRLASWPERARFADFVARHAGRDFAHGGAWRETHSFLRWSAAEAAERGDGFTLEHLFGPMPARDRWARRLALAPAAMAVLGRAGYPRLLAGRLAAVVRRSPVIVMMSLPEQEPGVRDVLAASAVLADYWLAATAAGLVLHPVSIVIQHEDLRRALQRRFGVPGRVFFVARLGRPAAGFPRSPRRPAAAAFREL
ncbi:RedV protein [Actinomadura roseirufa]|uniref:RedV protein n=1 Tax=Actinomadura roseirufa TaxID=2094049 RepID=UPI00104147FE|nr:RedV protein [Actinomadura roseirufa]